MSYLKNFVWRFYNKSLAILGYKTIGARALVIQNDQILLIKHTYMPKWHTIGGGIDKGETPIQAVQRELKEEVGITCLSAPILIGVYYHFLQKRDDYVVLYKVDHFIQEKVISSEILESQWFPLKQLPSATSEATKKRVEEYLNIREKSENW